MNIAIRVDASIKIGTGHVMRCLTLAGELRRRGSRVHFICRAHPAHMADMIAREGFQVSLLPEPGQAAEAKNSMEDYAAWLGVTQEEDAEQTINAWGSEHPERLIVDHYGLGSRWEKILRPYVNNIIVIDDLANRPHDCDLLLDQNYFREPAQRYKGLLLEHCHTLLGPQYALLRSDFLQARQFVQMRGNGVARVLVYFGGNDTGNLTSMALEALNHPKLSYLLVDAVIGPNNQHMKQLEREVSNRLGTRLHIQPEAFAELILRADICIGAGGTTTWERLCLNLPSLVVTVAANQEGFTKDLDEDGYVKWIGRNHEMTSDIMRAALLRMISNDLYKDGYFPQIVDGLGVDRVAETVISTSLSEKDG